MAIYGYFFNAIYNSETQEYDREYNAEDVTSYLDLLVGGGVFPNPSNQLQVFANSGMEIVVKAGQGWINGHKMINSTDLILTADQSDIILDRIDRVIFFLDLSTREMGIEISKGTEAGSPVAPDLIRNDNRIEYSLATIRINHGVSTITQSMITDTRPDSNVCGWVAGLIQQVDTSTLFAQWQNAYELFYTNSTTAYNNWKDQQETDFEAWEASMKNQFESWLSTLTEELNINTFVIKFTKSVTLSLSDSNTIPLDIENYTYEATDLLFVAVNGLLVTEGTDFTIDSSDDPATITINFSQRTVSDQVVIQILKSRIGFQTNE